MTVNDLNEKLNKLEDKDRIVKVFSSGLKVTGAFGTGYGVVYLSTESVKTDWEDCL